MFSSKVYKVEPAFISRFEKDITEYKKLPTEDNFFDICEFAKSNIHILKNEKWNINMMEFNVMFLENYETIYKYHPEKTKDLYIFFSPYFNNAQKKYMKKIHLPTELFYFVKDLYISSEDIIKIYQWSEHNKILPEDRCSSIIYLWMGLKSFPTNESFLQAGASLEKDPDHIWCLYALGLFTKTRSFFVRAYENGCFLSLFRILDTPRYYRDALDIYMDMDKYYANSQNIEYFKRLKNSLLTSIPKINVKNSYFFEYAGVYNKYCELMSHFLDTPLYEKYYLDFSENKLLEKCIYDKEKHDKEFNELYEKLGEAIKNNCIEKISSITKSMNNIMNDMNEINTSYSFWTINNIENTRHCYDMLCKQLPLRKYIKELEEEIKYIPGTGEYYLKAKEQFEKFPKE